LAPESTWGLEINVADDSGLDLDALEEMIESLGEEVGERTAALAEELNERSRDYAKAFIERPQS
jgi:hypothetical protein